MGKLEKILRPDLEFELPYKKNLDGYYNLLPNTKFIGSKNELRKLAAKKVKKGYIYLIKISNTNKYKLGVSKNPKRRLSDISNYIPFDLEVLALNEINNPYDVEQMLLNKYDNYLIKNEWFELDILDVKNIMIFLHNKQVTESIYG